MQLKDCRSALNALTDETRLRILNLLNEGELCVCDLMRILKEPQSKISRHLGYLRRSGLVEARKEGLWMHYRLSKPSAKMVRAVFGALREGFVDCKECQQDLAEYRKRKSGLVACCE